MESRFAPTSCSADRRQLLHSPVSVGDSQTHRLTVTQRTSSACDFVTAARCQHPCHRGNAACVYVSVAYTKSLKRSCDTLVLTCPRVPFTVRYIGGLYVALSSLPCPGGFAVRVYVLLMPWKPQKFQRFSRLAPTPVSSCLKVQGSRERRASTSLGLICTHRVRQVYQQPCWRGRAV